jgi:VCBS repeat-containing protein
MRLQTLLQRLKKQRATAVARQARAATREDLFPELGVTRLEERRLLNAAPVVMPDSKAAVENQTLTVDAVDGVLANDNDVDGDTMKAFLNNGPSYGLVTLHEDGSFEYKPNADFNGTDSFTYHANDGQADSNITTVTLNVTGVNNPPVNNIPLAAYAAPQNGSKDITGISISDPDSGPSPVITRFEVQQGTLSVDTSVPGILVVGNNTNILQVIGTTTQVNATLAKPSGLTYTPTANYLGPDQLKMVTNDGGATGAGGPMIDTDFASLSVQAVDQAPVNTLPAGPYSTNEDTALAISGISVADPDSGALPIVTRFEVQHGVLNVNASNPNVIVVGNGTSILQIVGSQSQINATLADPTGLTYTPSANYNGADQLKMVTNDLGGAGLNGPKIDTDFAAINVVAVNDAPVNTLPPGP